MSEFKRRGRHPKTEAEGAVLGDVYLQSVTETAQEEVKQEEAKAVAPKTPAKDTITLGVHLEKGARAPYKATNEAACWDVCAFLTAGKSLKAYNNTNYEYEINVGTDANGELIALIPPQTRVMVPTGIYLSIPAGYKVHVHPRSGLSLKHGVSLINCTGVIDADYTDELCVLLMNHSDVRYHLKTGERVAQLSLEKVEPITMVKLDDKPGKRGNRNGGFGSTGKE